ncbi:MAG: helix-turn-helix domain-containing protein [Solirubrobacteraceae bacterium]
MTMSVDNPQHAGASEMTAVRPMLTRDDTAVYLAVSKRTLDRLVQAGELPTYRISGHRRFRIEDIERFIRSRKE